MTDIRALRLAMICAALLTAAALLSAARAGQTITDASGRQVKVADTSRILSIGGDVTRSSMR
jgi:ABC-type hemin transport system substrate-binding protein